MFILLWLEDRILSSEKNNSYWFKLVINIDNKFQAKYLNLLKIFKSFKNFWKASAVLWGSHLIVMSVTWFRTCFPKIEHFEYLGWRNLRNSRCKTDSLISPFSPEAGWKCPHVSSALPIPGERTSLCLKTEGCQEESRQKSLANFPEFATHGSNPCPIKFFHHFSLFVKPRTKILRLTYFFGSSFPFWGSHVT